MYMHYLMHSIHYYNYFLVQAAPLHTVNEGKCVDCHIARPNARCGRCLPCCSRTTAECSDARHLRGKQEHCGIYKAIAEAIALHSQTGQETILDVFYKGRGTMGHARRKFIPLRWKPNRYGTVSKNKFVAFCCSDNMEKCWLVKRTTELYAKQICAAK